MINSHTFLKCMTDTGDTKMVKTWFLPHGLSYRERWTCKQMSAERAGGTVRGSLWVEWGMLFSLESSQSIWHIVFLVFVLFCLFLGVDLTKLKSFLKILKIPTMYLRQYGGSSSNLLPNRAVILITVSWASKKVVARFVTSNVKI